MLQPVGWMACVIVTYKPDLREFGLLVAQLLKSDVSIIVVDNWFSDEMVLSLRELCSAYRDRIRFIPLDRNYGIAKALNAGIAAARDAGHSVVMLFDQDSQPQNGLLEELRPVVRQIGERDESVAAIGPRLYDPRSGQFHSWAYLKSGFWRKTPKPSGTGMLIRCEFINSSGSLIFLDCWEKIGEFRESFFIDHVETDWYMRARHFGFKCYGYDSERWLIHHMGDDVCRYWFFGWRYMPRRAPLRHYTIVRNAIWMSGASYVPLAWTVNAWLKILFTLVYFSIFDRDRKNQFLQIIRGIRDGLTRTEAG